MQKSASRQSDTQKNNETLFITRFNDLFDIAHNDALTMIIDDKIKCFLLNQREHDRVGFIADVEEIQFGNYQFSKFYQR